MNDGMGNSVEISQQQRWIRSFHPQMSISGHKLYGPKGVGALYVRRRPRVRVEPIQSGGGQERGIRSGTVPTPLAVGLGESTWDRIRGASYSW